MQVRVLEPFSLGGGRDVYPGDLIELSNAEARAKGLKGWVTPAAGQPLPPADQPGEVHFVHDDLRRVTHRDPTPRRRG